MTPAELHAAIVARVQERLELAQAATPGPWHTPGPDSIAPWSVYDAEWMIASASAYDHNKPMSNRPGARGPGYIDPDANAALIAANDPKWTIGICEVALERLERHAPWQHYDVTASAAPEVVCSGCGMGELGDWRYLWPCAEVQAEAAVWGVEVDGDG